MMGSIASIHMSASLIRGLLFAVIAGACLNPAGSCAESSPPLEVRFRAGEAGQPSNIELKNLSSKAIVGYVLVGQVRKADGTPAFQQTISAVVGMNPGHPRQRYLPGESWVHTWSGSPQGVGSGAPVVLIDYVLFDDESTWGPDNEKTGGQLKGALQGWRAAYRHLSDVLANRGMDAVRTELTAVSKR